MRVLSSDGASDAGGLAARAAARPLRSSARMSRTLLPCPTSALDPSYAYPPAVPPAAYDYGVETFQAPAEPPPVYQGTPPTTYQALRVSNFWMPTDPRAAAGSASLQIEVTSGETEILVDGARVGMAKEFHGPVIVPVAAGSHTLEFRVGGLTIIEDIVASPQTTVLIKRDFGTALVPR